MPYQSDQIGSAMIALRLSVVILILSSLYVCMPRSVQAQGQVAEPNVSAHPVIGQRLAPSDVDRKHPIYIADLKSTDTFRDWHLEGGWMMTVGKGRMLVQSAPQANDKSDNQNPLVCWLMKEAPADFYLEFSVRPSSRQSGSNAILFSARARNGGSIFEESLTRRYGLLKQYLAGDLACYHLTYWSAGNGVSLHKSPGNQLIAAGQDTRFKSAPNNRHSNLALYKRGGMIRLAVDGIIEMASDDPANKDALTHPGWIGLRQVGQTMSCDYGHFRLYPLLPSQPSNTINDQKKTALINNP